MYQESVDILTDGDKVSENHGNSRTEAGMPAEPFTLSSQTTWASLQTTKVSHSDYADNIALTSSTAHHLQLQLDRFHNFMTVKGWCAQGVHKTKIMAFSCSNPPGNKYSHIQIFHFNQSPHPPRLLPKDAIGCEAKHKYTLLRETGQMPLYSTEIAVLLASGSAFSQPTMPSSLTSCCARSMRLIYGWHTGKEVGHARSYLLFARYLGVMCTFLLS